MANETIRQKYATILEDYINTPNEKLLLSAAELGRELVSKDIPLEDISEIHEDALSALEERITSLTLTQAISLASAPFMELLIAYGLAFRELAEIRKQVEETLRENEQRMRNVLECFPLPTFVIDLDHRVVYWNKAMEELSGLTASEAIGELRPWMHLHGGKRTFLAELLVDGRSDAIPSLYADKYSESKLMRGVYEVTDFFPQLGDEGIWLRFTASALEDSRGQVIGAIETIEDITYRKHAEQSLYEYSRALEQSNKELEQFAYVASHDLQEPLRMVTSYLKLLSRRYKGHLDADADDFITFAVDGAQRMQTLINDLLTYSRITTKGRIFDSTDCNAVLHEVLSNLQITIEESNALVTSEPLPTVMADQGQLRQLFQNLISNAIKFRSDEPPRVHVSIEKKEDEFIFMVADNGIGIDPANWDRIFEVFQRLHSLNEYPGTGIGLAICKKIVERHRGRIWIHSESGKGTTFYFTLQEVKHTD